MDALECVCVCEAYEDKIDFQGSRLMKIFFYCISFFNLENINFCNQTNVDKILHM